jgi:glycerophosphoryl diester phosphodiesterase
MPRLICAGLVFAFCSGLLSGCAAPLSASADVSTSVLPQIIAHRGGTGDAPENTLEAIRLAVAHHADAMWLTVQLSKDGVPVLYRPADLSALTDAKGPVSARAAVELARVNAGWSFHQALRVIPASMPVILDMKALPAELQTRAVAQVLSEENAWSRVTLYSTEAEYQRSFAAYPQAKIFESRDATRTRLVRVLLQQGCVDAPAEHASAAFELHRTVTVVEKFTLGEGRSEVNATLWTPSTVACFRQRPDVHVVAIAVNNADDYRAAACLGIDAVLSDSPAKMTAIRVGISLPLRCGAEAESRVD